MAAAVAEDGGGLRPGCDREIAALGCASVDRLAGEEWGPASSFPVRRQRTARYGRRINHAWRAQTMGGPAGDVRSAPECPPSNVVDLGRCPSPKLALAR